MYGTGIYEPINTILCSPVIVPHLSIQTVFYCPWRLFLLPLPVFASWLAASFLFQNASDKITFLRTNKYYRKTLSYFIFGCSLLSASWCQSSLFLPSTYRGVCCSWLQLSPLVAVLLHCWDLICAAALWFAASDSTLLTFQVPEGGECFLAYWVLPDMTLLAHSAFLEVSPSVPSSLFIRFLHRLLPVSWALALIYVVAFCVYIKQFCALQWKSLGIGVKTCPMLRIQVFVFVTLCLVPSLQWKCFLLGDTFLCIFCNVTSAGFCQVLRGASPCINSKLYYNEVITKLTKAWKIFLF